MNKKEIEKFRKDRIDEVIRYTKGDFVIGHLGDDYVKNKLTAKLSMYFYTNTFAQRDLEYLAPKPSFLDWLFGRQKLVKFEVKVKDILVEQDAIAEAERLYLINLK